MSELTKQLYDMCRLAPQMHDPAGLLEQHRKQLAEYFGPARTGTPYDSNPVAIALCVYGSDPARQFLTAPEQKKLVELAVKVRTGLQNLQKPIRSFKPVMDFARSTGVMP